MFDAAAGFGGFKQSGFGRDGGQEGFLEYVKPVWQVDSIRKTGLDVDLKKFGSAYTADGPAINVEQSSGSVPVVDHTYK